MIVASVEKQLLGTETVRAMRTIGIESKICGLSANDIRETYIEAGANDFVLKPIPCQGGELRKLLLRILSHNP